MPDSYNASRITQSFVTPRAVGMGLSLAILLNIWVPFGTYILHTSRMSVGHLPIAAFILFLAVLFIVNPLLRLQRPDNCLTGAELTLIFSILLISSLIPGKAFVSYFLTIVSTPFFPYLPEWLIVSNEGNAMGWFYEGLPQGQMIPWAPWIIPVFWWMTFFVALFFVGACTVAIFRKQWVEYERLTFPLVKVSRDLIAAVHQSGSWPPIVKDRLFQAGFVLAVSIAVWTAPDWYVHARASTRSQYPTRSASYQPVYALFCVFHQPGYSAEYLGVLPARYPGGRRIEPDRSQCNRQRAGWQWWG